MKKSVIDNWQTLNVNDTIWKYFFTVSPLVVIGTKENDSYDLAPKHMVTALGHDNYLGFVCTAEHSTYHNVKRYKEFTVSFIDSNQLVLASLAASPRCGEQSYDKTIVDQLPTLKAKKVDALFMRDSYLLLECSLERIVDGFGKFSLIAGRIINAQVHKDAMRMSDVDEAKMIYDRPMLAYIAYGRYAEISKTLAFPFPKDFEQKDLVEPDLKS